jgi:maltose alpha-D-glucosyltransferase/alpha-amylase
MDFQHEVLDPANRKVLAYMRQYQDERVLCVANLSRFAQPIDLDLSEAAGAIPLEMLGYLEFPPIERQQYRLTFGSLQFPVGSNFSKSTSQRR